MATKLPPTHASCPSHAIGHLAFGRRGGEPGAEIVAFPQPVWLDTGSRTPLMNLLAANHTAHVDALLDRLAATLRQTFGHRIDVSTAIARPLPPVAVSRPRLERCLTTLTACAVDTMPAEGALALRVDSLRVGDSGQTPPIIEPGRYVSIEIAWSAQPWAAGAIEALPGKARLPHVPAGPGDAAQLLTEWGGYMWLDTDTRDVASFTLLLPAQTPAR